MDFRSIDNHEFPNNEEGLKLLKKLSLEWEELYEGAKKEDRRSVLVTNPLMGAEAVEFWMRSMLSLIFLSKQTADSLTTKRYLSEPKRGEQSKPHGSIRAECILEIVDSDGHRKYSGGSIYNPPKVIVAQVSLAI